MSRRPRDWVPVLVGLVLVGGTLVGVGLAFRLSSNGHSDALALLGIAVGLVVGVPPLVAQLGRSRRPDPRPVDELANLLAQAVDGQWRKEAAERRLLSPDPIPIRWSLSDLAVTGAVAAAVGAPDTPPAFPPLPQQARVTEADLQAGGGRAELHRVYAGLASGRVVVIGAPGAGKSGTAILLLLDSLAHRDRLDNDAQRARTPVPVLLTAHGWDPTTCSVSDWLRDQLTVTYPLFQPRNRRAEAAALIAARDKVTLILDGLDEMAETLRPAALQALNDAPFRVVVLTRSQEMVQAASRIWLTGAIAVHLHHVSAPDAADYLQRALTGPPPLGWTDLLNHLREYPDSVLARGLSTPLTLTLLRDTYQVGDDLRALLDLTVYRTTDAIEEHLIARVLPAAYTPRPGRPLPRYTEQQARQTLSFIARKMGKNRDLVWWHISRWAPATPRILAIGLMIGLTGELSSRLMGEDPGGFMVGLVMGLGFGFLNVLVEKFGRGDPQRVRITNWRATISRRAFRETLASEIVSGLKFGLLFGPVAGLVFGFMLVLGLVLGDGEELEDVLVSGLVFGFGFGLLLGLLSGLSDGLSRAIHAHGTGAGQLMDPRQVWSKDRMYMLGLGLGLGIGFGLLGWLVDGLVVGLVLLTNGLLIGLLLGLICYPTGRTTVTWLQLQLSRQVPAISLIPFLEEARKRDVLRTVGAVYQFRHATLQDQLSHRSPRTTQPPRFSSHRRPHGATHTTA